jgi:hypothetical protein
MQLDKNNNIIIKNGAPVSISGVDEIRQYIKNFLLMDINENVYDTEGIDYINDIWDKNVPDNFKKQIIKQRLSSCKYVDYVVDVNFASEEISKNNWRDYVNICVMTKEGALDI